MKKVAVVLALFVALAGSAQAAMTFKLGPGFNFFNDSRISGMNSQFQVSFDLDQFSAGYKVEKADLTVSDAQNSVNNVLLSNQLNALIVEKEVANIAGSLPVTVGLELGSLSMTELAGTCAIAPGGLSQTLPVVGLQGGIKYQSSGKNVMTCLYLNLGYRYVDIRDTVIPAAFTAGGANFKDLNAMKIDIGVGLEF